MVLWEILDLRSRISYEQSIKLHAGFPVSRHAGFPVSRHAGFPVSRHAGFPVSRHAGFPVSRHILTQYLPSLGREL